MKDLVVTIASKEGGIDDLSKEDVKLFKKVYKRRVKSWNRIMEKVT